jgi:hypothetical protein
MVLAELLKLDVVCHGSHSLGTKILSLGLQKKDLWLSATGYDRGQKDGR